MEFEGWSHGGTNYSVQENRLHVCMNMGIWKVVPSWTHNLLTSTSLHILHYHASTWHHLLCSTHSHNMGPFTIRVDGISYFMTTSIRLHSSVLSHHETAVLEWMATVAAWQLTTGHTPQFSHIMRLCSTGVDDISCCMTTSIRPHSSVLAHHGTAVLDWMTSAATLQQMTVHTLRYSVLH
jgi:hypothetical protein